MYRKPLLFLIIISTIIRIVLASVLELGNDEVYYYTYALHLQSNYFDHPPGIAYLIRLFTFDLHFKSEIFIRAGAIFCAAIGTILTYKIGTFLKNKRTGWIAALLYNTSIYCSIIAGTFILPDSPQIIFWLLSFLFLLIIIDKIEWHRPLYPLTWILFGLFNGLCIMCKVHGVFIWGGFGLYILFYNRKILTNPWLYISFLLTLVIIFPIFWWNYSNHFVTYNYHSARVGVNHFKIDTDSLLQTVMAQWFYNGPVNVVLAIIGIFICSRRNLLDRSYFRIIMLCGLPMIVVVTIMSLFNSVLPHWSGPGFLTLSFVGAVYVENFKTGHTIKLIPSIIKITGALMLMIILLGIGIIEFMPGTIGSKGIDNTGENDFTLDLYGWRSFGNSFKQWYSKEVSSGLIKNGTLIVCNKWFPAAHIDYYVAPSDSKVVALGDMNDIHHYYWLNKFGPQLSTGQNALCIIPSNYPTDVNKNFIHNFSSIKMVGKFVQTRSGHTCRYFNVFLLSDYKP